MADNESQSGRHSDRNRHRLRDFTVLTVGAICVLSLLLLTNTIGLIEWITGTIVMLAGSLAYYVGTLPTPAAAPSDTGVAPPPRPSPRAENAIAPYILSMPFPALLIGEDGRLQTINAPARDIFRVEETSDTIATAAIRQPDLLDAIDRVSQTGAGEMVEFSLRDDAETWMAHLQAGPEPGSVLLVLEDLTAVRRAELARADFLANASHELRTPLTAVGGFIETMRGPAKDDKDAWDGFLEIMQSQTERMKRLVADLLSLSRIEFSEHRSPSTRIDATALIQKASLALQPIAGNAGVSLNLTAPEEKLELIADEDELMQVVQNLAGNAIKYARQGGAVNISFAASKTMAEAAVLASRQIDDASRALLQAPRASDRVPAIWLRVEDDGAGIPSQHLPRLGERFYRADESRGGETEGTGLGLAIVKHIMARHRGGLAVESVEGEGATFGIWLPLAPQAQ